MSCAVPIPLKEGPPDGHSISIPAGLVADRHAGPALVVEIEAFGDRLRRLRKRAGYRSQQALATAIGVDRAAVSLWETEGECRPRLHRFVRLCALLGVTMDYLYFGSETLRLPRITHKEITT